MMTGEEYKASLFDGRATFFEGKRVDDIPAHPYLGPPAQGVADDYDWLKTQEIDGHSPINGVPTSPEELRAKVDLVHAAGMMAHVTYTSIMTLATVQGKLTEHRAAVRRAHRRLHQGRPADATSASPSASPTPRATGRGRRRARTTPTPTSTSSTAAPRASSSAAPSCTSRPPRSATT